MLIINIGAGLKRYIQSHYFYLLVNHYQAGYLERFQRYYIFFIFLAVLVVGNLTTQSLNVDFKGLNGAVEPLMKHMSEITQFCFT